MLKVALLSAIATAAITIEAAKPLKKAGVTKICNFNSQLKLVGQYAAGKLSTELNTAKRLQTLGEQIEYQILTNNSHSTEQMALLAQRIKQLRNSHNDFAIQKMAAATYAAAICAQYAGRVDTFIHVFAQAQKGNRHCIDDGSGTAVPTATDYHGCLHNTGKLEDVSKGTVENLPALAATFEAIKQAATDLTHNADKCGLTDGRRASTPYGQTGTAPISLSWGNGMFQTSATDIGNTPTHWPKTNKELSTDSSFAECNTALQELTKSGPTFGDQPDKLNKLLDLEAPEEGIKIDKNAITDGVPSSEIKISKNALAELTKAIAATNCKLDSDKKKTNAVTQALLKCSKATTSNKDSDCGRASGGTQATEENCNAIGDDKDKCNAEKQCSYDDTKDAGKKCKYNATKATANGAPVTKTETSTGGTQTTTDKCKDKKMDECKSPDCKWEGEKCKDSIFLLNKKFFYITAVLRVW
uniref:Variant surface glycoprotein 1125.409 n=1 Tax=Trypanosoma brucei TaxID=5691 RepID=M4TAW7_9TRYP|nr:variant surface glycoprotein 1151 [Trypanosoma brucei]APD73197.1 variant surface glycoprotein 1125.409 [Trypanosoma brucei]